MTGVQTCALPISISQALGGVLHVPHGVGVAIATPLSLRFNAEASVDVYAELARDCGVTADSRKQAATAFVDRIIALLESLGLPNKIEVPDDAPDDLLEKLVQNAFDSTPVPIKLNPRKIDEAVMRELFQELLP